MAPHGPGSSSDTFEEGDFVDYSDGDDEEDLATAEDSQPAPRPPATGGGRHTARKT